MTINWKVSMDDSELLSSIADRAKEINPVLNYTEILMDITAAHANGNPLRLDELLAADKFNFTHDVYGIHRHIDRNTGKLTGFFVPRFTRSDV